MLRLETMFQYTSSVHRLAKYVVGPQGLGQEKLAGLAKNAKDMQITDVIYIFQPTKFSQHLFLIMNHLPLQCIKITCLQI